MDVPPWREDLAHLSATLKGLLLKPTTSEEGAGGGEDAAGIQRLASMFRELCRAAAAGSTEQQVAEGSAVREWVAATIDTACRVANDVMLAPDGEAGAAERAEINNVLESLHYINQMVCAATLSSRALQSVGKGSVAGGDEEEAGEDGRGGKDGGVKDEDLVAGIARFSKLDVEDTNRMQQLLLYLFNCAQSSGYRRLNGWCYQRASTPEGHDTHAWRAVCKIRDFVYDVTRKEIHYEMWKNLTMSRTNVVAAVEHLTSCTDVQFPDLKRDRHVFSFSNGLYISSSDDFVPYGSAAAARLPHDLAAAKYFDAPFPHECHSAAASEWRAIPTPHLQSILDFQGMSEEVQRWLLVMLGRLMYDVNEKDTWQVLPYLKGAAATGKSTILMRICRGMYEVADVGIMSNNIERKFGLSAFYDRFMFIGPEMKSDMQLEQAEFQSIVSGETVQVAIKFQTAQSVDWRAPGILAGNEVPGWVDNSGSINRRIVLFLFPNSVQNGDMGLGKKLDRELPAIMLKANRAYLEAVRLYSRDNVWKHLPTEFHLAKEELSETVNSVTSFLRSGQLQFGPDVYMPMDEFSVGYQAYVQALGLRKIQLTKDNISSPLMAAAGCRVKKDTLRYPRPTDSSDANPTAGGRIMDGKFIIGADWAPTGRSGGGGGGGGWDAGTNNNNSNDSRATAGLDFDPLGD